MKDSNAIVIKDLWGKLLSGLVITGIMGGIGFAWNTNAQQAVMQEQIQAVREEQSDLRKDKLPERVARIEEKVTSIDKTVDELKVMQQQTLRKLDALLEAGSSFNH